MPWSIVFKRIPIRDPLKYIAPNDIRHTTKSVPKTVTSGMVTKLSFNVHVTDLRSSLSTVRTVGFELLGEEADLPNRQDTIGVRFRKENAIRTIYPLHEP